MIQFCIFFSFFAEETGSSQTIKDIKLAISAVSNLFKIFKVRGVTLFLSFCSGINGISAAVAVLNILCYTRLAAHCLIHILTSFVPMRTTSAQLVLVFSLPRVMVWRVPMKVLTSGERGQSGRSQLSPKSLHTPGQLQRQASSRVSSDKTRPSTGDSEILAGSHVTQTAVFLRLFKSEINFGRNTASLQVLISLCL